MVVAVVDPTAWMWIGVPNRLRFRIVSEEFDIQKGRDT
jgi:hypothetical protein